MDWESNRTNVDFIHFNLQICINLFTRAAMSEDEHLNFCPIKIQISPHIGAV